MYPNLDFTANFNTWHKATSSPQSVLDSPFSISFLSSFVSLLYFGNPSPYPASVSISSTQAISLQGRLLKHKYFSYRMWSKFSASPFKASRPFQLLWDYISPEPLWPYCFSHLFRPTHKSPETPALMPLHILFPPRMPFFSKLSSHFFGQKLPHPSRSQ